MPAGSGVHAAQLGPGHTVHDVRTDRPGAVPVSCDRYLSELHQQQAAGSRPQHLPAYNRGASTQQIVGVANGSNREALGSIIAAAGSYLCPQYKQQAVQAPLYAASAPSSSAAPTLALTVPQQQAIGSAKDYLCTQAFSKKGLIGQLSSKYGDGFPRSVARFAVNHLTVDWNQQAARDAKEYLQSQLLLQRAGQSAALGLRRPVHACPGPLRRQRSRAVLS